MKAANTACKKAVAEAKLQYWEAQAKDKPGDLRTKWQSLKILRRAYNPPDHDLTTADGRVLQSLEEKAQGFLQHFASASTTAELPMAQQQLGREGEEAMDLSPPSGQDEPLTHFELTRALRGIQSTKSSPGGDRITYPLLKKLPSPCLKTLLAFFNKCRREGTVPQAWKDAIIVPVPKANKPRRVVSSYRPVSLTSHLGQLYERIMLERLQLFIQQKNLLPKYKAGFRKRRSVTDHAVRLGEHMRREGRSVTDHVVRLGEHMRREGRSVTDHAVRLGEHMRREGRSVTDHVVRLGEHMRREGRSVTDHVVRLGEHMRREGRSVTDHVVRLGEHMRRALARRESCCRASSTLHEPPTLSGRQVPLPAQAGELFAGLYKQDCHIYTDGSVLEDDNTGAGVYLDAVNASISLKLSPR